MFLPSNITLQFGDSGDFVTELQRRLAMVNAFSEDMINGFFDGNTVNGVTHFQAMVGLHADGVAGPETLRRLNGMVAGGGSAPSDKKEEEKAPDQAAKAALFGIAPPQENPLAWGVAAGTEKPVESTPVKAEIPAPMVQEPAKQPEMQAAAKLQPDPAVAAMFFEQQAQQSRTELPLTREPVRSEAVDAALQEKSANMQKASDASTALEAKAEPKGIIARVTQFASEYLQRLANYFEARLPPSVLHEVKDIGAIMARSGMRETPVPTGPEMLQTPVTPARGAGQAQQL